MKEISFHCPLCGKPCRTELFETRPHYDREILSFYECGPEATQYIPPRVQTGTIMEITWYCGECKSMGFTSLSKKKGEE